MVITPKIRGFVCVTAHPVGCDAHVQQQIDFVKARPAISAGPRRVLVIGSSTGYGLSSRIAVAFGSRAATLGVFFERAPELGRLATAGWYNSDAFDRKAEAAGLWSRGINGDAFSDAIKQQAVDTIRAEMGQVDLVVYSLASPRRQHPRTGAVHRSTLKPIGAPFSAKTVDTDQNLVLDIGIEPASEQEIADTVAVMGGEDWEMWIEALRSGGALAPGATTLAYDYIGPELTWPVYTNGTIGAAKKDLRRAADRLDALLRPEHGRAFISVNKALVTQASSAIPVVPLYIAILYKVMKERGLHEGCIEQMHRLFSTQVYSGALPSFDSERRLRMDDWEMRPEIQAAVAEVWPKVTTENLEQLTDMAGYRSDFLKLFGFGLPGVDYYEDVPV